MKKYIYIIGVMLLAVMTACTNEDIVPSSENMALTEGDLIEQISFTVPELEMDDVSTRGFYNDDGEKLTFLWSNYSSGNGLFKADTIGVFPMKTLSYYDQVFFPIVETTNSNTAFFDGLGWGLRKGYTYGAYYPYNFNYRNYQKIPIDYTGQRQFANKSTRGCLSQYDFMASGRITPENDQLVIPMTRIGAIVQVELDFNDYITGLGSNAPESIDFVEFTLGTNESVFALHGSVNLSATTPVYSPDNNNKTSSVSMELSWPSYVYSIWTDNASWGWKVTLYMALPPTDLTGKTLTATLIGNDGKKYVANLEGGKNIEAGKAYKFAGTYS